MTEFRFSSEADSDAFIRWCEREGFSYDVDGSDVTVDTGYSFDDVLDAAERHHMYEYNEMDDY